MCDEHWRPCTFGLLNDEVPLYTFLATILTEAVWPVALTPGYKVQLCPAALEHDEKIRLGR